jgi:hypothetical protein
LHYGRITWVLKKIGFLSIFENSIASRNTMKEYRKTLEQEQQGINKKAGRAAWDQSCKLTFLSKCFRLGLVFIPVLTFLHDDEIKGS